MEIILLFPQAKAQGLSLTLQVPYQKQKTFFVVHLPLNL